MKTLNAGLLLSAALLLAGCDEGRKAPDSAMTQAVRDVDSVLPSGWKMNDHGKPAFVTGNSRCPDASGHLTDELGCVIVGSKAGAVTVSVWSEAQNAPHAETWTVQRSGNLVRMKRPDNSDVTPWAAD